MKLFALDSHTDQGERVARALGVELAAHEEREFEDTEFKLRPLESVRGNDVVVLHSLYSDAAASSSDRLCRLLFFIGALRDADAAHVHAVVPYLAFARKDRRTKSRDPITIRYVAQIIEAVGLDSIAVVDVHNVSAYENAFRCPKEHLEAAPLIIEHFVPIVATAQRVVVVSPDVGGVKRARAFADSFAGRLGANVDIAFVEKHRSEDVVSGDLFAGSVADAAVIIVDDLISGGTTMARAADACKQRGALEVHVAATHGLFSKNAFQRLSTDAIDSIVVTDTVGNVRERCPELSGKLQIIDIAELIAQSAQRMAGG